MLALPYLYSSSPVFVIAFVGVWTAEAWAAEDDASSDVDAPNLDYKKD